MTQKRIQHLAQIEQPWAAIHQRHHVYSKYALQWRVLVEIVQDNLGNLAASQFNHDTHAILVGFVA